jgi:hypothetical protein
MPFAAADAAAALAADERLCLSRSPKYLNKEIFLFWGASSPVHRQAIRDYDRRERR